MKRKQTQAFGLETDLLLRRYLCEADFPEAEALAGKKQYFADRGISLQSQFDIHDMALWAVLADVVEGCPWATALCEQ